MSRAQGVGLLWAAQAISRYKRQQGPSGLRAHQGPKAEAEGVGKRGQWRLGGRVFEEKPNWGTLLGCPHHKPAQVRNKTPTSTWWPVWQGEALALAPQGPVLVSHPWILHSRTPRQAARPTPIHGTSQVPQVPLIQEQGHTQSVLSQ